MKIDLITLATPFFILSVILEIALARFAKTRTNYEVKDTLTSLGMGRGSQVFGLLTAGLVIAATLWVYQHRIFTIPMTAIWAWVAPAG